MSNSEEPSLAWEDVVLFVELDAEGERTLVGVGDGNFTAPDVIMDAAKNILTQIIEIRDVRLGSKVGILRVLGRGLQKQVVVHADIDEELTRETFDYEQSLVSDMLNQIRPIN